MNMHDEVTRYLDFCQYRKELNRNTLKAYRIDLAQFQKFIDDDYLARHKIENYITDLHMHYKQKTIKRKIASVKAFYQYLEEEEILPGNNPFHKIKVKFKETAVLPRIIPKTDIEHLLNHMYHLKASLTSPYILRDLAVIEILFATGARIYELTNLHLQDINLECGTIRLLGKGSKERYIQIANAEVLSILQEYQQQYQCIIEKSGYFFVNNRGLRFTEQSVRNMLKKYAKQAHISQHITPHLFRHSVATYLLEEGVDIVYIQQILGHSSLNTTRIYLHVSLQKQLEIIRDKHPRNSMQINPHHS